MQAIFNDHLEQLLSCNGAVVGVTVTDAAVQISLRSVVPLKDYKTLAALGRQLGCSFDARTKTTTIPKINKALFKPSMLFCGTNMELVTMEYTEVHFDASIWNDVAMILKLNEKARKNLFALVKGLGSSNAKTYATVKAAMADQPTKRVNRRVQDDDDNMTISWPGPFDDEDRDEF